MYDFINISDKEGQVTPNFSYRELYNRKTGLDSHPLDLYVIKAVQAVRDYYGIPIRTTSTYRNYIPPGGVKDSPHMRGLGIDFQFIASKEEADNLYLLFREEVKNKNTLFHILWNLGVRGFGSYDNFIHLDTWRDVYKRSMRYEGEIYSHWDKMKRLKYRNPYYEGLGISSNTSPSNNNNIALEIAGSVVSITDLFTEDEDGITAFDFKTVAILIVIGLGLVFGGIFTKLIFF